MKTTTEPSSIVFLVFPYGLSVGFATVTLPFLLIQHGFSVAAEASITAVGISAIVLHVIGKGMVSTRYALLSSISNIPPVYMTIIDGWLHDKYNITAMLRGETLLGLGFVIISFFTLSQTRVNKIPT
jgi:hypothetical protein